MLSIRSLNKSVVDGGHRQHILNNLELSLSSGASLAITGDSGSGKSTLLNLIASLDKPDSGQLLFEDQDITRFNSAQADHYRKRQVGIVFQQFNLIDCMTVYDNIAFPARLNKCYQAQQVVELLHKLGLSQHQHKLPHQLSGGEQQRVAIGRAFIHKPKLILADEPTGNLDTRNSDNISDLLFGLCEQYATSLILVTHSQTIANKAHQRLHLSNGQLVPA